MIFPASTNGGGQGAGFPDVCKTPSPAGPVPIPYPNITMMSQANSGTCAAKVKIDGKKAMMKGSETTTSTGDEAGSAGGGVISNMIKGPAKFKNGSSKVKVEGKPLAHLTSMLGMNGSNANVPAGVQVAPSQTKVMIMP